MNSLYVFGETWDGPVKVGVASDVAARLEVFRFKLPFKPMLLLSRPHDDAYALEAHVHRALAEHRLNGEWFDGSAFGQDGVLSAINSFTGRTKLRNGPDEYSLQVGAWVRAIVEDVQRRTGCTTEGALPIVEAETGIRRTFLWSQMYRPAVRVFAADYFAAKAAFDSLPNEPTEQGDTNDRSEANRCD